MRLKILLKPVLFVTIPLGLALFAILFLLDSVPKDSIQENSTVAVIPIKEQERYGLPLLLKIPSIKVNAPFEYVGLTPDGAMDIPKGPDTVAWFNLGSRPGENGSAVISGHYGWKNNTPAVFDNLHKLRVGDKISIEDDGGVVMTFVVRETRIYDNDEVAPEVFSSSDGKAHLNLITCTGKWNKAGKTYSDRLVIFTDKE